MNTMVFDDTITKETVTGLIHKIEKILDRDDRNLKIYFSTPGGEMEAALVLVDFMNSKKDRILLYATDNISSSGISVFFGYEGKRKVMRHTYAVIHAGDCPMSSRALQDKESKETFFKNKILKGMNKEVYNMLEELGIDETTIGALMKGEDRYLSYTDLSRMLKKQEATQ